MVTVVRMGTKMKNVKNVTIMIQSRIGSSRLPGKVLAKIEGKPMIWHVIHRIKQVEGVQKIVLITTRRKEDRTLLKIAKDSGIAGFTGPVNDVLKRHYECATYYHSDPIIRITGDCPLIDPKLIEKMLQFYLTHDYDYVSNTIKPTYPDGLDVEIFSFATLSKLNRLAKSKPDREHVTAYIRNNQNKFSIYNYENNNDLSKYRWTVDQKEDLNFVRKIYSKMKPKTIFTTKQVLYILNKNPQIQQINSGIIRNAGYLISLKRGRDKS